MSGEPDAVTARAAFVTDVDNAVLCWLATVDADGTPNVSPKEIFAIHADDRLVIADIASAGSVANIRRHPAVCVSFIDVFRERGFKVKEHAVIIGRDAADFDLVAEKLVAKAGPDFPVRHAILVNIDRVERIWAPSYRLFPDRSLEDRIRAAHAAYGVEPRTVDL